MVVIAARYCEKLNFQYVKIEIFFVKLESDLYQAFLVTIQNDTRKERFY